MCIILSELPEPHSSGWLRHSGWR